VEFKPVGPEVDKLGNDHLHRQIGDHAPTRGLPPRHPYMHRTETVDYGIILSGEIYLIVDEGEILCRPGDIVIQRGTNHAWANRSKEICRIAFILIESKEP